MFLEFDSFALTILKDVSSRTATMSIEDKIVYTEELLVNKAPRLMPSKVGSFEESVLIGLCVASRWSEDNADLIKTDEFEAKEQLYALHQVTDHIYENMKRITCKDKRSLEEVICLGFKEGIALGYKVRSLSVCSQMTTAKILETFEVIKENPSFLSKIISSRAPNSILAKEHTNKKCIH